MQRIPQQVVNDDDSDIEIIDPPLDENKIANDTVTHLKMAFTTDHLYRGNPEITYPRLSQSSMKNASFNRRDPRLFKRQTLVTNFENRGLPFAFSTSEEDAIDLSEALQTMNSQNNPGTSKSTEPRLLVPIPNDQNNVENTNISPISSLNQDLEILQDLILQDLRQEIANLKQRLTQFTENDKSRKFICQYCLRVPDGSSYSLNCGHLPFCDLCSKSIIEDVNLAKRICPMCKAVVHMRLRVFTDTMQYQYCDKENESYIVVF